MTRFKAYKTDYTRQFVTIEGLEDDPRIGRPKTVIAPEIVEKVHKMFIQEPRLKVSEITKYIGIKGEKVFRIVTVEIRDEQDLCKMGAAHIENGSKAPENENF